MEIYILVLVICIGFYLINKKLNVKSDDNNSDEVKELNDRLTKVLGRMESDNKNLRQAFITILIIKKNKNMIV